MKTMRYILLLAIAMNSLTAFAQKTSYRVITTDPDEYKRTVLYLGLINFDTYNITVGGDVKLETVIKEKIMPWVSVRYSWLDLGAHHVVSGYPTAVDGLKNQLTTDIGGVFFLTNHNKKTPVKVVLHSHQGGGYIYSRYLMVDGEKKKMFGLRGGINMLRRVVEIDEEAHPYYRYKSADGSIDVPIDNVGVFTHVQPAGESYKPLPLSHTTSLYAGVHLRRVLNTRINAEGYGKRANANVKDAYFDLMLAPSPSISKVRDAAGKDWEIVPQSGAIRHFGWRAGIMIHGTRGFGYNYYWEFGQKTGPMQGKGFLNNGSFTVVGMGINIGSGKYIGGNKKEHKNKKDKAAKKDE